ncbi:class I SAM-dependent methyltransferase [Acidimicrobiaceae bacterium]|nr:class I SAM-dependent methyltransferase [Acidimicrobiaceae bacterium]
MNEDLDIAALESLTFAKNYNSHILKLLLSSLDRKDNILDFGAGYGLFTEKLKKKGYKISALEKNEKAIKKLKEKNLINYKTIDQIKEKIDCVISLNVLEHIENDQEIVKDIYNLLKKDGKLLLYVPSSNLVWSNLDVLVNHVRRYDKKELKNLLSRAGFEVEQIYYVDFIGWSVLLFSKLIRMELEFDKRKIKFYDKYIFIIFKFFDKLFKNIIGKNLFVVAKKL